MAATRPISVRDNELSTVGLQKKASGLLRVWPVGPAIDSYTNTSVTCFNVLHVTKVKREHLNALSNEDISQTVCNSSYSLLSVYCGVVTQPGVVALYSGVTLGLA